MVSSSLSHPVASLNDQDDDIACYTLQQEQWFPRPINEVFTFFADAHNLEAITPPWLGFKILTMSTISITEGTVIRYRLRLHGVPIHWQTDICKWDPPYCFVDVQREGPYKKWHHTHIFEAHDGRTKMVDVVRYSLPFGILGKIAHTLKVRADIQRIFDYRRQRIDELFSERKDSAI
jgi:ligand-binding SRPBCC domain-containing protein